MNSIFIVYILFINIVASHATDSNTERVNEETATTNVPITYEPTTFSYDAEEIRDIIKDKGAEFAAGIISKISKQMPESRTPINEEESPKIGLNKAHECSLIDCPLEDKIKPVCACNFNTGNVASFKNKCDAKKHNCRFDTNFKVILEEICPWEFAFRRANGFDFDYSDAKYYN